MALMIGIDLGTTNSLCAVFRDGQPQLVPNVHGEFMTPSVVGVTQDDQVLVGAAAKELGVTRPEQTAACFKRLMGTGRKVELSGRTFTAPELSSLVLTSLKQDADKHLGTEVREAVITVPAYFNDNQRKATKLAGELAGLNVRRIINEPTSAALTYGFHNRESSRKLIVIDLGGGTFDVTTMEVFEGTLEIISTAGDSFLGGEDFTERLIAWTLETQGRQLETAELKSPLMVSRLRQQCEQAKRALFGNESSLIKLPDDQGQITADGPTLTLTRGDYADIVDPVVKRLARPIAKAIRDSRSPVEEFTEVILVGGATRSEVVRSSIRQFFGVEPLCQFNPDEVVALGAAVQAALIEDDQAVDDLVMTDVCPFTLGVEVSKEFGRHLTDGYYLPVIHRNTTIPVSREEIVCTVEPNQRHMHISIYQGEARKVKENLLLGELNVSGIPPGPSGQNVHIRFTYDINGILEVEAYVPESGKKFSTVLTQHAQGLNSKDINAAVHKMQSLKFYPRDDLANQHLVLFAERVIGEIGPFERDNLESAIDRFEQAMSSGSREDFELARDGLLTTLSSLDFPYQHEESQDWSSDADNA